MCLPPHISEGLESYYQETRDTDRFLEQAASNSKQAICSCDYTDPQGNKRRILFYRPNYDPKLIYANVFSLDGNEIDKSIGIFQGHDIIFRFPGANSKLDEMDMSRQQASLDLVVHGNTRTYISEDQKLIIVYRRCF